MAVAYCATNEPVLMTQYAATTYEPPTLLQGEHQKVWGSWGIKRLSNCWRNIYSHHLMEHLLSPLNPTAPHFLMLSFLREEFHHILDRSQPVAAAIAGLDEWAAKIRGLKITLFDRFLGTLARHKEHIANYVIDHVSNAVTEGLNNLVRSIQRCAFGMPNFEHLRLRVMAISGEH